MYIMLVEMWTVKTILILHRNEEHGIGNWRKGDPCYKVAKNLDELCVCSSVLWKVELTSDETGHQAEAISMQSVEEVAWFYLTAYSKTQKERNKLRMELLRERNQNLEIWKFLSLSILQKNEKAVFAKEPRVCG